MKNLLLSKTATIALSMLCVTLAAPSAIALPTSSVPSDPSSVSADVLQPGLRHPHGPVAVLNRFDSNRTVNLKLGQTVAIDLAVPFGEDHTDPTLMWSGLALSTDAFLRPENTTLMFSTKPGVTGQTYEAIHPGTTVITSHRNADGNQPAQDWTVTIQASA